MDRRQHLYEFDFGSGELRRELAWEGFEESELGQPVDLEAADGHLYVCFQRAVLQVPLRSERGTFAGGGSCWLQRQL